MADYSYSQIEQLWDQAGGDPSWAATMAGIAEEESSGNTGALNNNPNTGDYSVGLWQINYFGDLLSGRTAAYGSPSSLQADPTAQAHAAISLLGGGPGLTNWTADPVADEALSAGSVPLSESQVQSILGGQGISTAGGGGGGTTASLLSANTGGGDTTQSSAAGLSTPGKILAELDAFLNPQESTSGIFSIIGLTGLSSVQSTILKTVDRGLVTIFGFGIFFVGLYMFTRQTGVLGAVGIIQRQEQLSTARTRTDLSQQRLGITSAGIQQRGALDESRNARAEAEREAAERAIQVRAYDAETRRAREMRMGGGPESDLGPAPVFGVGGL